MKTIPRPIRRRELRVQQRWGSMGDTWVGWYDLATWDVLRRAAWTGIYLLRFRRYQNITNMREDGKSEEGKTSENTKAEEREGRDRKGNWNLMR